MKISDIKEQKSNKDRFSIYVEGKYSFSLNTNDLIDAKIKVGDTLDETQVDNLKAKSADSLLLARACDKCMRRPHSEKEIRDYLWKKQASPELTDSIVGKCYDLRLLNDEVFAEKWAAHRRRAGKSNRYIQNELRSKGISAETINSVLDGDDSAELRKMISKKRSRYPDEKKLIAYLQRQGFSYTDIQSALMSEAD